MSLVTDIADAVVQVLNSQEFCVEFTAERQYSPQYSLAELADLKVSVVPRRIESSPNSRGSSLKTVQIDIGIQKKLGSDTDEGMLQLLTLVEEIKGFLNRRNLETTPRAIWCGTENEPVYAQEHLVQFRQFTSVITLTYKVCA